MNTTFYYFILFLLCGCSLTPSRQERRLASKSAIRNCPEAIAAFKDYRYYDIVGTNKVNLRYTNDLEYTKDIRQLEASVEWWISFGSRKYSQKQVQDNFAYGQITKLMKIDSPFNIARRLRNTFEEVETAYFVSRSSFDRRISLEGVFNNLNQISRDGLVEKLEGISSFENYKFLKKRDLQKIDRTSLKALFEKEIKYQEDLVINWGLRVERSLETYRVTRNFLEQHEADEVSNLHEKAKNVLNYLDIEEILADCLSCGDLDSLVRPTIEEVRRYVGSLRVVQIKSLKRLRVFEAAMSLISRAPSTALASIVDSILKRTKWIKSSSIRKEMRSLFMDNLETIKFFPIIDGIVFSEGSDKDLAEALLREFSVKNDQRLLLTFERRIDTSEIRKRIYNFYKSHSENPHYSRMVTYMDKAKEDAKNLTLLIDSHLPDFNMALRFVVDFAFLSALGYSSYELYQHTVTEVEDRTGLDLSKIKKLEDATTASILESSENHNEIPEEKVQVLTREIEQ